MRLLAHSSAIAIADSSTSLLIDIILIYSETIFLNIVRFRQ